jgi:hypothetical protein
MRLRENTIIAAAGFAALVAVLGVQGTWLIADPRAGAIGAQDSLRMHSDTMWRLLSRR